MYIFKDTKRRANPHASYVAADGTKHLRIPSELLEWVDEPAAPEDYSADTYIRTEMDVAPYVNYERRPNDVIAENLLAKNKLARHAAVAQIVVTTQAGNSFDGDEDSQNRMSRAINGMLDGETTLWVLADKTMINATKEELREALRLAGVAQTEIWVQPYLP